MDDHKWILAVALGSGSLRFVALCCLGLVSVCPPLRAEMVLEQYDLYKLTAPPSEFLSELESYGRDFSVYDTATEVRLRFFWHYVHLYRGDSEQALAQSRAIQNLHQQQSLGLPEQMHLRLQMGFVERLRGDLQAARAAYSQSCQLAERVANYSFLVDCNLALADLDSLEDRVLESMARYRTLGELLDSGVYQSDDPRQLALNKADLAYGMAINYQAVGDHKKAIEHLQQAIAIETELGDHYRRRMDSLYLAKLHRDAREHADSNKILLDILAELSPSNPDHGEMLLNIYTSLGRSQLEQGENAAAYYQQAQAISNISDDAILRENFIVFKAQQLAHEGRVQMALSVLDELLPGFEQAAMSQRKYSVLRLRAKLLAAAGQPEAAFVLEQKTFSEFEQWQRGKRYARAELERARLESDITLLQNRWLQQDVSAKGASLQAQQRETLLAKNRMLLVSALLALAALIIALLLCQRRRYSKSTQFSSLTGVFEQGVFYPQVRKALADGLSKFVLIRLDIDSFAQLRQELGQAFADEVATAVALLGRQSLRQRDMIGRLDEDKFLLVVEEANLADGEAVIQRLSSALAELELSQRRPLSVSAGMVLGGEDGASLEVMVARAEQALAQAQGPGAIICQPPS